MAAFEVSTEGEARSDAMAYFGQRLLSAFTAAVFIGLALVTLSDASSIGRGWLLACGFVLVVLAAATGLIITRSRWRLPQLRIVEAVVFATLSLYLAARTYAGGTADLGAGAAAWTGTLTSFGLLMIGYGVFVLNPLIRAVIGVVIIGVIPVAAALIVRASQPDSRDAFDALAAGRLFETTLVLGASAAVAIFAAFLTFTLFTFAYDQRKRTFYDLEERIGSGGMGEVWRGRHETLARPTAIKLIREDKIKGVGADYARRVLQRFKREAKATAALRSPHTIEVYDFGVTGDGHFFYAMEFLDGLDLQSLVERFGAVPAERVVHLLIQACDSLADAHDNGMVHRDIKPANLFLSRLGPSRDHIKLLDFGLVQHDRPAAQSGRLTEEGTTAGTPAYMAPETFVQENGVDNRSDIYALGCVAYWLATGKLVFETDSGRAQIVEHVKTTPLPPSARTELPIPPALEAIIMKCLEKDPADRFQDGREMANALREVPLTQPWDTRRADEWWDLHVPVASVATTSRDDGNGGALTTMLNPPDSQTQTRAI